MLVQDVRCARCGLIKAETLRQRCACSGEFATTFPASELGLSSLSVCVCVYMCVLCPWVLGLGRSVCVFPYVRGGYDL